MAARKTDRRLRAGKTRAGKPSMPASKRAVAAKPKRPAKKPTKKLAKKPAKAKGFAGKATEARRAIDPRIAAAIAIALDTEFTAAERAQELQAPASSWLLAGRARRVATPWTH